MKKEQNEGRLISIIVVSVVMCPAVILICSGLLWLIDQLVK